MPIQASERLLFYTLLIAVYHVVVVFKVTTCLFRVHLFRFNTSLCGGNMTWGRGAGGTRSRVGRPSTVLLCATAV